MAQSVMRRPSLRRFKQSTDGSSSPPANSSCTPPSSFRGSSYFTSKVVKRAKKASEDSPNYSSPLSFWTKRNSPEIEESLHGTTIVNNPGSTAESKSLRKDVQDWNITRLFDPIPSDSINQTPVQGPSHSNSDWNEPRNFDIRPIVPQQGIDPPRPAREGYEWVWFPAGYWAERELPAGLSITNPEGLRSSKTYFFSRAAESGSNDSEGSTSPKGSRRFWGSFSSRVVKQYSGQSFKGSITSAISSSKSERFLNTLQSMSPTYSRSDSPSVEPEGLCGKTKRTTPLRRHLAVPFSRKKKAKPDTPSIASSRVTTSNPQTARVLEGAIGYFDTYGEQPNATSSSSNASMGSKPRWRFGTLPWHRRLSDNSMSASSSICDLLAGKTPMGTPRSDQRYVGAAGKSYVKVEISEPDAPTFLPSEAQRVDTPLWSPKRDPRRGFLSNMFPYESEQKVLEKHSSSTSRPRRDTNRSALRNLLKTPTLFTPNSRHGSPDSERYSKSRPSTPMRSSVSQHFSKAHTFELNVPDHLPNSPLCPANPMHPSNGQAVCPMHGRNRTQSHSPSFSRSRTPDIEIRVTSDQE
ncbi:hypothetical protein BCON_0063g00500 [Botryotinia convoluta]|uniref:Uncharacterized protein n=1 Tax=Botryotinia convoluta TaxID=54673 RepID=A0A4Z1IDN5_9HELO|nr:hypothetical protein BCON_0063g00500 [Botryotinia convoluta]